MKVEVVVKGVNDKPGCKFFRYQWERESHMQIWPQLQGI